MQKVSRLRALIWSAVMRCSRAGPMDTKLAFIALLTSAVWRSILTELKPKTVLRLVSRLLKFAIVVLCFSLCGAGSFIVSMQQDEKSQQRTNVMPVKNHQLIQRSWIRV